MFGRKHPMISPLSGTFSKHSKSLKACWYRSKAASLTGITFGTQRKGYIHSEDSWDLSWFFKKYGMYDMDGYNLHKHPEVGI